jgi:hypothetical protein
MQLFFSYMTRLTRSLTWQASAWTTGPIRLRQGGRSHSFSQKFCTLCKIFVKKKKCTMLPQAILPFTG